MIRLIVLWVVLALCGTASAAERITAFDSAVTIDINGVLTVTETIQVIADGTRIRRGIYRDFPTTRDHAWWGRTRVDFEMVSVTRDGAVESWFPESRRDGLRIYFGDANRGIGRGAHTYVLTYRTGRQIGFFTDHDTLVWNVTGNDWAFPIDRVAAHIALPANTPAMVARATVGQSGSRNTDVTTSGVGTGDIAFETRKPLSIGDGLTVAVDFAKGAVTAPTALQRAKDLLRDNLATAIHLAGLLLIAAYYLLSWWRFGRDPALGPLVARYDPPPGLSPASCRYLRTMAWDETAFASALVDLAARGYIRIERLGDRAFQLVKTGLSQRAARITAGEKAFAEALFSGPWQTLPLRPQNFREIREAQARLRTSLAREHEDIHFILNKGLLAVGVIISTIALAAGLLVTTEITPDVIVGALIGGVILAVVHGTQAILRMRGRAIGRVTKAVIGIAVIAGVSLLAIGSSRGGPGLFMGLQSDWDQLRQIVAAETTVLGVAAVVGVIAINTIFFAIMKAPTLRGQRLMDHIEGFRHYLTVAEQDRLNFHNPPDLTPHRFEAYLPYAMALDVAVAWTAQFDRAATRAAAARGEAWNFADYTPSWYSGGPGGGTWSWGDLTGRFDRSVADAAVAPTETGSPFGDRDSGGGLGGTVGSGGGGGGGGGW